MLYKSFYDVLRFSNIRILKCYKLVFSFEGEIGNYGSILMVALFAIYIIFDCIFLFNGIAQLKILIGKIIFNDKSKNNNKKINKHMKKYKVVKLYKMSVNQTEPPPQSTKNIKIHDNNGLIAFERRIFESKRKEIDEDIFNYTFTKNKFDSKTELISIDKKKGNLPRKKKQKKKNIFNQKSSKKILVSNDKKDKEKIDIVSNIISDDLSKNFIENFNDISDKKVNTNIISCDDIQENDLNIRSINIYAYKNDNSESYTRKIKIYDRSSGNNDSISANRLTRISSLNNSINNFVNINNNDNTKNNSINQEPKGKKKKKLKKKKRHIKEKKKGKKKIK